MPEERTTSSTGGQKGVKLAAFDLIPAGPLIALAEHYGRGARKYASHQWRAGYEWSKSLASIGRHWAEILAGRDYDVCSNDPTGCSMVTSEGVPYESLEPDTCYNHTGSHHATAIAWHAFAILEFAERFPQHDDRYLPKGPEIDFNEVAYTLSDGPYHCYYCNEPLLWNEVLAGNPSKPFWVTLEDGTFGFDCSKSTSGHLPNCKVPRPEKKED